MTPFIFKCGSIVVVSTGIPHEKCGIFCIFFREKREAGWVDRRVSRRGGLSSTPNLGYFFSPTLSHFFWDNFVGQIVGQGCQEGLDFSRIK